MGRPSVNAGRGRREGPADRYDCMRAAGLGRVSPVPEAPASFPAGDGGDPAGRLRAAPAELVAALAPRPLALAGGGRAARPRGGADGAAAAASCGGDGRARAMVVAPVDRTAGDPRLGAAARRTDRPVRRRALGGRADGAGGGGWRDDPAQRGRRPDLEPSWPAPARRAARLLAPARGRLRLRPARLPPAATPRATKGGRRRRRPVRHRPPARPRRPRRRRRRHPRQPDLRLPAQHPHRTPAD